MFSLPQRTPLSLLLLTVSLCFLLLGCNQTTSASDPVAAWLHQHAIPLTSDDPTAADGDLAPLTSIVGNADMVGLGEMSHGSHEIIRMKARVVEDLVTHLGFTTFIMENEWGRSQPLDDYIKGGTESLATVMQSSLDRSWQTQEYADLWQWMRAYNAAHTPKVHFWGMDCQSINQSEIDAVVSYLQRVDPTQAAPARQHYTPILTDFTQGYFLLDPATKQQHSDEAQNTLALFQAHQQDYISRSSASAFALAQQNAQVIAQFATYANSNDQTQALANYAQRDIFMAQNVAWIRANVAGNAPKMMIWAHDAHVANNPLYYAQTGAPNMGGWLRAKYGTSYLTLGTSFYAGSISVFVAHGSSALSLPLPVPNTYNTTLGSIGMSRYMLDLRTATTGAAAVWATGPHTLQIFGLGGEDESAPCSLKQWFDVIIHLQTTTPSQVLSLPA